AVLVFDERNEGGAVRVVFDALNLRRRVELAPLEVDQAVGLLVTTAAEAHGHAAGIVAATRRMLPFGQHLYRCAMIKAGAIDQHQLALARRNRVVGFECHRAALPYRPVVTSMV